MKIYLLSAAAVIFLSVIVSLVIPEGKLNKTIVFVMRMACIFVLIQPITGIFKVSTSAADKPLYDYEYICKVYSDNQSDQLQKLIFEKFDVDSVCIVNITYDKGDFKADSVSVEISHANDELIENIYSYLQELKYTTITVNSVTE